MFRTTRSQHEEHVTNFLNKLEFAASVCRSPRREEEERPKRHTVAFKSAFAECDHSKRTSVIRASRSVARAPALRTADTIFTLTPFKEFRDHIFSDLLSLKSIAPSPNIVIVARALAFAGCASCVSGSDIFFRADFRRRRGRYTPDLFSYPTLTFNRGYVDMGKAWPSYSKPRLCHIFSRRISLGGGTETEYFEMPGESEFTSSHEFRAPGAYCIPGFFDNSSVKLRLIHVERVRRKRNLPREKLRPDFRPRLLRAADPHGPLPPL